MSLWGPCLSYCISILTVPKYFYLLLFIVKLWVCDHSTELISAHTNWYLLVSIFQEDNHRVEEREWMGCKYIQHHFDFETSKQGVFPICGLTASILIRAASIIYQRSPCLIINPNRHLPDFQQLQRALRVTYCKMLP